jgi:hypothetical protein
VSDLGTIFQTIADGPPAVRNAPYVRPDAPQSFNTPLDPASELAFRAWVKQNNVPFNPDAAASDYDMRGFWQGLQQQNPRAATGLNANDGRLHYPDFWKTPQHQTFSGESQWAGPVAPQWNALDQLVAPSGRIMFDERAPK